MSKAQTKYNCDLQEDLSEDESNDKIENEEVSDLEKSKIEEAMVSDQKSDQVSENNSDDNIQNDKEIKRSEMSDTVDNGNEIDALREENRRLRAELNASKRLEEELAEFADIFPEQDIRAIPDEVWLEMRRGSSLSAAFALFERKRINREARASEVNLINAHRSSGRAGSDTPNEFFSPEEVRSMSQGEVRANYTRIIESMKKWN